MLPLIVGIAIVLVVVIAIVLITSKRKRAGSVNADTIRTLLGAQTPDTDANSSDPAIQALRQNLRVKLLYQEDKVDAAIAVERERNPSGTLEELMKAAIERWERDNR